ncbi:ABC transporter ATP-binding protein [Marinobacterium jannaschii]|uniref:ABC transporter ATP-binding protein n=1 Tax=Marinobacterium jannaschii TaxID=64970 RepID=UPI000486A76A|nr:ABC transporter ATP-binding protein [Marinobacterium jannaschii]
MSILQAKQLYLSRGGNRCLRRVDFQLRSGELVGLIGPNGAGKSSLLSCLAGLGQADQGEVWLQQQRLAQVSAAERGRRLGYLAQQGEVHWPITVERLVMLGRTPHLGSWQQPAEADLKIVERAMRQTDVLHLRQRPASELSGGEKARVLLARLLAGEPQILLADEPTAALDMAHQLSLMQMLQAFVRNKEGRGAVVVLHDLNLASRYCDRIVMLDQGEVVAQGTASEVLTEQRLAQVYGIEAALLQHPRAGLSILPLALRRD